MSNIEKEAILSASFKLPSLLNQNMNKKIIEDGYGMKGKSKWIIEAIDSFLQLDNYVEIVGLSDDLEKNTCVVSLRAPRTLMLKTEEAIVQIRKEFPLLEGVKSKIFRASIYQRVLNNFTGVR